MERARRLHRPSLKNWQQDGLADTFGAYRIRLESEGGVDQAFLANPQSELPRQLPVRLDARSLATEDFWECYEGNSTPCVVDKIPFVEDWKARHLWTLEALEKDEDLRSRLYKCGEDDDGRSIKIKLKHFLRYLHTNRDDSPLYIFDTAFDEDKLAKRILRDYQVPIYFRHDLFNYVSESRRAPYRWFLVGPERSGTTVHIDPLATSAWNTLLCGQKRWVIFPPHLPKSIVKGKGLIGRDEDDEAIHYFTVILPRIRQRARERAEEDVYRNFACYEFTQQAGETVFVPTGWWHAVLNLTHTVGVTQNFCSPRNFEAVWCQTRSGRKRMAWKWLQQLKKHEPALAEQALKLNKRDGYIMKYDPAEMRKREERKRKLTTA